MENEETNFDNQVPPSEPAENSNNTQNHERLSLKDMSNNFNLVNYEYVKALKIAGHTSIADMIFKEAMALCCAANLSSDAIGRNRFVEFLENGYYSSGKLLMLYEFSKSIGVEDNVREGLVDSVTGMHKIFAASIKTVRAKAAKVQSEQVNF
ncbi:MAG: hypothetical protein MJ094_01755 [Saccharofermentans sp.]|nr:hypothetical protein [Saccharofermentans sp.]